MKKTALLFCFQAISLFAMQLIAQVAINNSGAPPHPNAMMDINGEKKGLLIPRGDAASRTFLNTNTAKGLLMYDTVDNNVWVHNGNGLATGWQSLSAGTNYWMQRGALGTELKNTNSGGFWSANASTVVPNTEAPAVMPPVSGAGTRLMWMPQKSAFRVGTMWGYNPNYWDAANIGIYSFATGINTISSGYASVAMGNSTGATGGSATAMGSSTGATGDYSTAMGDVSFAEGYASTAMGSGTQATGHVSTSMGASTKASGPWSTAMGRETDASGNGSTAMGQFTKATGMYSASTGLSTTARSFASVAIGQYNDSMPNSYTESWQTFDPLLILGNGTSNTARNNALVVYKNGNTEINGYTKLGNRIDAAPSIKMKEFSATTAAAQNDWTDVQHNLTASKILSVSILADASPAFAVQVPPSYHYYAGYEYDYHISATNIVIINSSANSFNILKKPLKILVTYKE